MTSLGFVIGLGFSDQQIYELCDLYCKNETQKRESYLHNAKAREIIATEELDRIIAHKNALKKKLQNIIRTVNKSNITLTTCRSYFASAESKYIAAKQIYEETKTKLDNLNSQIAIYIEESNNTELQNIFVTYEAIQNDLNMADQDLYDAIQVLNQEYVYLDDAIIGLSEAKVKVIQIKEEIMEINTLISLAKENLTKTKEEIIAIESDFTV